MEIFWEGLINYEIRGKVLKEDFQTAQAFDKASTIASEGEAKPQRKLSLPYLIKKFVRRRASEKHFVLDEILACPSCKGALQHEINNYHCSSCQLFYPIQNGIPILLKESAKSVALLAK